MRWLLVILTLLVWACRTAPAPSSEPLVVTAKPDVPPELSDANAALREYLRVTQLGLIPAEAQENERVLRGLMRWKTNRGRDVAAPFEAALTRGADPDVAEFALLRLAVLQLNLGCEVSGLQPPAHLPADRRQVFDDMLDETGLSLIEESAEFLGSASALHGRRQDVVDRLRAKLPRFASDVRAACRATKEAWSSPDDAGVDDVARAGCEDDEGALCWVWAKWGSGGEDALAAACEDDLAEACVEIADRLVVYRRPQSNPSAAEDAERLYGKACRLGSVSACRKELAVFIPARRDAYQTACLEGDDAAACHKLTRVLTLGESASPLWWSCTSRQGAEAKPESTAPATCEMGDAFACAKRAGSLATDPGYLIDIEDPPADDAEKATLQCGEGDNLACLAGAKAFANAGNWGCSATLLIEACGRGVTEVCGFYHGAP